MRWLVPGLSILSVILVSIYFSTTKSDSYVRAHGIELFFDANDDTSPEEAQRKQFEIPLTKSIPAEAKHVWLKVKVPDVVRGWQEEVLFFTGSNESVQSIAGYAIQGSSVIHLGTCHTTQIENSCSRKAFHRAFSISADGNSAVSALLIKLTPGGVAIHNEFYFMKRNYFSRVAVFLTYLFGFGTGVCVLVAALGFVFYFSLREQSFLYYALFYVFLGVALTVNRGIWDLFKPEAWPIVSAPVHFITVFLWMSFDLLFLRSFFHLAERNKRINKLFIACLAALAIICLLSLIPATRMLAWKFQFVTLFGSMALTALTLVYLMRQNRRWASQMATAWGVAISFNLALIAYRVGLIEGNWSFGYFSIYARILEAFIINSIVLQKLRSLMRDVGLLTVTSEENSVVKTLLRTLSHDLSNTTQTISLGASVIEANPAAAPKYVTAILKATQTQTKIIENAKSSFLSRGSGILKMEAIDLVECLTEVASTYEAGAKNKGIALSLDVPSGKVLVMAEETSLSYQVLGNLIGNAIKFTSEGGSIRLTLKVHSSGVAEIKISDTGIGIPTNKIANLFDEAKYVSSSGTAGESGSGHGLIIVRDFMATYGGELQIDSVLGRGTVATLKFKTTGEP